MQSDCFRSAILDGRSRAFEEFRGLSDMGGLGRLRSQWVKPFVLIVALLLP